MKSFLTKWSFSLFLMVIMTSAAFAQKTVSGVVTDAGNGDALIGANVLVKGTDSGTITDIDGSYSLRAKEGDVLVFSYAGYADQEVTIGASNTYNVSMAGGKLLDEVVVVGYGSQKTKEITSAVVSVGREDFNKGPIADAAQLLQGKVAGLQSYNRGGDPNRPSVIRMRGISTIGANAEPLVVIDGIIGASLSNIDPADIETMDVLKDGSASAIYGTRGSAGVIIITTRKGSKKGGVSLSYNGQVGVQSILRSVQIMDAAEFRAAGGADLENSTDWLKEVTQNGLNRVHNLSAEGGTGNSTFRVSANLRNVDGILRTSGFDQFNTRLNFNTKALNDKLTIDFNSSFTNKTQNFAFNEALRYAVLYNPTAPVQGADLKKFPFNATPYGGYFETLGLFDSFNPVSIIEQNYNIGKVKEFNFGADFKYNILDNLSANFRVANQNNTFSSRAYYPATSYFRGNATSPTRKGRADFYNNELKFKLYEGFLNYVVDMGKSNLNLVGGYSYQQTNFNDVSFGIGDFPNNDLDWSNNIGVSQDFQNRGFITGRSGASPDEKIIAMFGRANYTFDDAIFVNASIRREGSTRFGEGNQWGIFPAFGVGVDVNKYANINNVDLFKVRLGYGVTGSLPRLNGLSQELRAVENGPDGSVTTRLLRAANPDLKWEEKKETNLGIDFKTGRLGATLDIYNRDIDDAILEVIVDAAVFGAERQWQNAASLNTRGLELSLDYDLIKNEDVTYNTGLRFNTYKTKISKYIRQQDITGNLGAPGQNGTNMILIKEGEEVGQMWGPVFSGTVNEKGEPVMVDLNGDGKLITGADKWDDPNADMQVLGKGIPDFELGWVNSLDIKGWNINAFFRGAFGHSLVNEWRAFYEPRLSSQTSYNFVNTELAVPGLTTARYSSLYVEKADFFMLDNLTISRNIGSNKYLKNVNVSLTGQNLFIITKYTGASPEPNLVDYGASDNGAVVDYSANGANPLAPGIDRRSNYFSARTFTLGVNFNF
jgi:TonB-dependent starch-binding outer membrane protein SusC